AAVPGSPRTRSAVSRPRRSDPGSPLALDLLGLSSGRGDAAPAWDERRERSGSSPGRQDQEIVGRGDERAQLRVVAGLYRSGHAMGALEVGVGVLGVIEQELPDL